MCLSLRQVSFDTSSTPDRTKKLDKFVQHKFVQHKIAHTIGPTTCIRQKGCGPDARGSLLLNFAISVCPFPSRRVEIIQTRRAIV